MIREDRVPERLGVLRIPLFRALHQIKSPSLPSHILWLHREVSQLQEEVQWKIGSVMESRLGIRRPGYLFPLSLTSCMILGKSFHHYEPQFPHVNILSLFLSSPEDMFMDFRERGREREKH